MKIKEVIYESRWDDEDPNGELDQDQRDDLDPFGEYDRLEAGYADEPEMELSSRADSKMTRAVRKVCDSYKGQGHAQVELLPFLTKVMEIVKKPVNLADLIAINKQSEEIRSIIDTIDEKKVKFKNMSVKNEDPAKDQKVTEKKQENTVAGMASRAAKIK